MSYLSLYRKWRPRTFADVLGQAHVTETFVAAVRDGRIAHAYLFAGPRGTGKTSTARILAKALNCETGMTPTPCGSCRRCREIAEGSSLDVYEMDAASHTSVDDVREIRERIPFASADGGHKVYIIDEAHQLSTPAFNALLKMLEEPPPHVVFVLCTTESHKLPATVVSRCQRFEFRRIPADVVTAHLAAVAEAEGIPADADALSAITRHAKGSARDALSLLDQAAGTAGGKVTRDVVRDILGEPPDDVLLALADAVRSADVARVFATVDELIGQGWDPRHLLRQLLETFRALLLASRGAAALVDADDGHRARLAEVASGFGPAQLDRALRVLGDAQADMRLTTHPRLTLEIALARSASTEDRTPGALLARVERIERMLLDGAASEPVRPSVEPPVPDAAPSPALADAAAGERGRGDATDGPAGGGPIPDEGVRDVTSARPSEAAPPDGASTDEVEAPSPADARPSDGATDDGARDAGDDAAAVRGGTGDPLTERWESFLEVVRSRKKTTYALVKEGRPVGLSGGVLRVAFANAFHAEAILKPTHTEHLASAAEEAFGEKLRLESEVNAEGATPARREPATATTVSPVDLVTRALGAEVVDEVDR